MENPQLSPQIIYAYDTHKNIPWNTTEYQPVRQYLDPKKQITQRKYLETPKGGDDPNYVTKRGFYMDYHIKTMKVIPSPCDHPQADYWDQTLNLKKGKINKLDLSLSKNSYLDQIVNEQKRRSTPAPGSYRLQKTQEEINKQKKDLASKKRFIGDKHFFYQDLEYLSSGHSGMAYHPHLQVDHVKVNKTNHKFWIEKHKKQGDKYTKRRSVEPAPGTHTPIPAGYVTFDRIMTAQNLKRSKKDKQVFNGFGSDAKFQYCRPSKKKISEQRPAPCSYNLQLEWKGKNMDAKTNNWIRTRSTGMSRSVYH